MKKLKICHFLVGVIVFWRVSSLTPELVFFSTPSPFILKVFTTNQEYSFWNFKHFADCCIRHRLFISSPWGSELDILIRTRWEIKLTPNYFMMCFIVNLVSEKLKKISTNLENSLIWREWVKKLMQSELKCLVWCYFPRLLVFLLKIYKEWKSWIEFINFFLEEFSQDDCKLRWRCWNQRKGLTKDPFLLKFHNTDENAFYLSPP